MTATKQLTPKEIADELYSAIRETADAIGVKVDAWKGEPGPTDHHNQITIVIDADGQTITYNQILLPGDAATRAA